MKSVYEQQYTSTTSKMLNNLDLLAAIKRGKLYPTSVQIAPTDICNLNCSFCSVKNRAHNTLEYHDIAVALREFRRLGSRTVEFTGGGDPTMYPYIESLINDAYRIGYKIGLITNGVFLNENISNEFLQKLEWVRVSLNSLEYVNEIELNIPKNVTLGFSYVWNEKSDGAMLEKIAEYAEKHHAAYVRIVPNCLTAETMEQSTKDVVPLIEKYPRFFWQQKTHTKPESCLMGYIKPFVNSDGYIYHCSASPLIERKFTQHFRMGHISEIRKIWEGQQPFDTSLCQDGKCFFREHNELIQQIQLPIAHKDFI